MASQRTCFEGQLADWNYWGSEMEAVAWSESVSFTFAMFFVLMSSIAICVFVRFEC
jgi:hypothetical protein